MTDKPLHEALREGLLPDALLMLVEELRNPLQLLRSELGLLRTGDRKLLAVLQVCAVIDEQAVQLSALVDDLAVIARREPATFLATAETLDLRELLTEALNALAGFVAARELRLMVRADTDRLPVRGDRVRLKQVLTNLLMNAAQSCEAGDVIQIVGSRVGTNVHVRMRDTGRGIPPHLLERVFEPFVRLHAEPVEANGVGLTVAHLLVGAHGGTLEARSDGVGQGSELTMVLPIAAM